MRRGASRPACCGNEASVLVGDFLRPGLQDDGGSRLLRALQILSGAAAVIAEGEVMQLGAAKNTATTEDECLMVIRPKTAELFAAACESARRCRPAQGRAGACRSTGEPRHRVPARHDAPTMA